MGEVRLQGSRNGKVEENQLQTPEYRTAWGGISSCARRSNVGRALPVM